MIGLLVAAAILTATPENANMTDPGANHSSFHSMMEPLYSNPRRGNFNHGGALLSLDWWQLKSPALEFRINQAMQRNDEAPDHGKLGRTLLQWGVPIGVTLGAGGVVYGLYSIRGR